MTNTTTPDAAPTTPLAADDPRRHLAAAVTTARGVIAALRSDQLHLPTPCPDLDVTGLLAHLVGALDVLRRAGAGEDVSGPAGDTTDVAPDGWTDAWVAAAHGVQEVWQDDALLDRSIDLGWATMSGAEAVAVYTNEVVVHTWDLARATGQQPVWDDGALQVSLAALQAVLPAEGRQQVIEQAREQGWEFPFAAAVPVADDAPLIDRLVAWNGRRP